MLLLCSYMLNEEVHILFSTCILLVCLDALLISYCKRHTVIIPSSGYCPDPDDFITNYCISFVIFLLGKSPCPFSSCSQEDITLWGFVGPCSFCAVALEDGKF